MRIKVLIVKIMQHGQSTHSPICKCQTQKVLSRFQSLTFDFKLEVQNVCIDPNRTQLFIQFERMSESCCVTGGLI